MRRRGRWFGLGAGVLAVPRRLGATRSVGLATIQSGLEVPAPIRASQTSASFRRQRQFRDRRKIGVVEEGALADLLLVDGDPVANIKLIEDPAKNFVVIMKDGRIYKSTEAGQ